MLHAGMAVGAAGGLGSECSMLGLLWGLQEDWTVRAACWDGCGAVGGLSVYVQHTANGDSCSLYEFGA